MKKAFVEQMARIAWREFPGHFGGALSKALVGPDNAGLAAASISASRATRPTPTCRSTSHKVQEQVYYVLEGEGVLTAGQGPST